MFTMFTRHLSSLVPLIVAWAAGVGPAAALEPVPPKVPAALADAGEVLSPSAVHIDGWLGARIDANESQRLLLVDTEPLLAGYRKRPGSHPWIGEHVGKWMHAATLAWAYSGDRRLREKLDRVAAALILARSPTVILALTCRSSGLGSFRRRLGRLVAQVQHDRSAEVLRIHGRQGGPGGLPQDGRPADCHLSGEEEHPGGRHALGMAATSVLEPIVLLYRATGDQRYLQFARYIVKSWDEPNGPRIAASLLKTKRVDKTANGKAYEMLSNLVGVCELARASGDRELLIVVKNAWEDIVTNRLYITGTASNFEHFRGDHDLPNTADKNIGETCVTTTWIHSICNCSA